MSTQRGFSIPFDSPEDKTMIYNFGNSGTWLTDKVLSPADIGNGPTSRPATPVTGAAVVIPTPGVISRLFIQGDVNATDATEAFTVLKNNSATAITCNTAVGADFTSDFSHAVNVTTGDLLSILDTNGGSNNFGGILGTLQFIPR